MDIDIDVGLDGPMFNGEFEAKLNAGIDRAKVAVAGYGMTILRNHSVMFRYEQPNDEAGHPGYWERQLHADNLGDDVVIADRAVYTAWLEGVGSRNAASKFKGYGMWKRTKQQLDDRAADIAAPIIDRAIS